MLIGAAPLPTVYSAPAGYRAAGSPRLGQPFSTILPNGRIVAPVGKSTIIGMNALGVVLAPGGKYAIVSNDESESGARSRLNPRANGSFSLAVVNTATMQLSDSYAAAGLQLFMGLAALKDPADPAQTLVIAAGGGSNRLLFFVLDGAGRLTPESAVSLPAATDARYANQDKAFPGWITLSPDHRIAYVVNDLANTVSAVDIAARRVLRTENVGFFPWAAATANHKLYVTDRGLMQYARQAPATQPAFTNVTFTAGKSSALTTLAIDSRGDIGTVDFTTAMDRAPNGADVVGGAAPSAIVTTRDGKYAFICMSNVDRVAVVSLQGEPRVVSGLQLRLFDRAPYGTQPDALALSPDGKRLYIALAGMNAIAVVDSRNPHHLHRLGLIPTGWYPSAIAVSDNGRYLFVTNAKGIGHEPGFQGGPPYITGSDGHIYKSERDANEIWSTLQRIDLKRLPLEKTTYSALRYLRVPSKARANPIVPVLRSLQRSTAIKHVVFILEENKTYDAMLGDLVDENGHPYGNGDPALVSYGASITPNLHKLAREYALATNFYADSEESDAGHQFATAGIATTYTEKTLQQKDARRPVGNKNEDPEDYPREGYIFNSAERAGLTYRDYGDLIRVSGYDDAKNDNLKADDPGFVSAADQNAPTAGLGGLYSQDVPALAALNGHVDLSYPGWNLRIRDMRRAREFIRDDDAYKEQHGTTPDFTYIWLPDDHGGDGADIPPLPEEVADGDRALGAIVDYLSHQPEWASTAIFITPDDAQSSRDHVSEHRVYAIVVSPYARRHYTGAVHLSTVSILKTEEELLGLPPLSLGDLLATDMASFFTETPDESPYSALPVATQTASAPGRRIAALLGKTDQSGPDADADRAARIIDYSRRADALAARRRTMTPREYARAQSLLYEKALAVIGTRQDDSER